MRQLQQIPQNHWYTQGISNDLPAPWAGINASSWLQSPRRGLWAGDQVFCHGISSEDPKLRSREIGKLNRGKILRSVHPAKGLIPLSFILIPYNLHLRPYTFLSSPCAVRLEPWAILIPQHATRTSQSATRNAPWINSLFFLTFLKLSYNMNL